jgi:hypothetical protein
LRDQQEDEAEEDLDGEDGNFPTGRSGVWILFQDGKALLDAVLGAESNLCSDQTLAVYSVE